MALPTNVGFGPQTTSFISDRENSLNRGGLIGGLINVLLFSKDVGAVTDEVQTEFKLPFEMRLASVSHSNQALTGTCTFDLYNETDSALIIPAETITTGAPGVVTTFSSTAQQTLEKGDIIQLRATAGTSIVELSVWIIGFVTGEPDNPQAT